MNLANQNPFATPKAIAQFAASFASYMDAYGPQINADRSDDGFEQSAVKMWMDHFQHRVFNDDSVLFCKRTDIDTALFAQLLEQVLSRTYDKPHVRLLAREFVPEGPPVHPGAETVKTFGFDHSGSASVLASYGEDVNKVEVHGKSATRNIVGVAAKWAITVQQVRASALAGVDIDGKSLLAAKKLVDRKIDELIADGEADLGIDGFLALTTSSVLNETKTGDLTGDWSTATVAKTDDIWTPTDLILDTPTYNKFKHTRLDSTMDVTLLSYFSEQFDLNISKWKKCDTAGPSDAVRAVFYEKTDEVVSSIVSQEPEQFPAVWTGLGWETVMHARCGGVRVENPKGILYADHAT
jgi:hypothetical protein